MITRKRINNDIAIRWAIFKPDGSPVDFTNATIKKLETRAKTDGSIYKVSHNIIGNILEIQFPASEQRDIGIHNLYLEYTEPDATVKGGIATYTLDYCDAFELVPITCMLLDPQEDPVVIQGVIASFTYSMLTEDEKNDLAGRLRDGIPSIILRTNSYIIKDNSDGTYTPSEVKVTAHTINTTITKWKVGINNQTLQVITESNSPFPEVSLSNNVITITTTGVVANNYLVEASNNTLADIISITKIKDGEPGAPGGDGSPGSDGEDGTSTNTAFVYKVSVDQPETPTDNYVPPVGWTKNFPVRQEGSRIWLSTIPIVDNILVGSWSEPSPLSALDGKDGEDGITTEFIYKITTVEVAPELPEMGEDDDFIPIEDGWTDNPTGIDIDNQFEWVAVRERVGGKWGTLKGPTLWSRWGVKGMDGDGVEYVYKLTKTEEAPEPITGTSQDPEYHPEGWTDDPSGVGPTWRYEWVCVRHRRNEIWSAFSEPSLWATYAVGETGPMGPPGLTTFTSIVFLRSDTQPDTPTEGSWEEPLPTSSPQWTDGIPAGDKPLWMTSRIFTSSGGAPQQPNWGYPRLVADTADIDFEYSEVLNNPGNPTDNPGNWSNTASTESYWMAIRKKANGEWGSWEILKIKGEDGKNGIDGNGNQTIYTRTTDDTRPATPESLQDDSAMPFGWTRGYTGVTNNYKYEWVSVRTKNEGVWSEYSLPGLYSKYSEDGAPGQQGLAGCVVRLTEWDHGFEYRNDEDLNISGTRWIDLVMIRNGDGTFAVYKCIATHSPSSDLNRPGVSGSNAWWEKFVNMPPIYTPIILADNAVITFSQSHELIITDENGVVTAGMSGHGTIRFWAGGIKASNAKIKIYEDGSIEGMGYEFKPDGSGHLADRNIIWNTDGNATFKGKIESNSSGSRIVIDPSERRLMFYRNSQNNPEAIILGASNDFGRLSDAAIQLKKDADNWVFMDPKGISIKHNNAYGTTHSIGVTGLYIGSAARYNGLLFSVTDSGGPGTEQRARIEIPNLPTVKPSSPNILWKDGSTVKIS